MSTYILTSMFFAGFENQISERLKQIIKKRNNFAFVASEFEKDFDKTDRYFNHFLKMFENEHIYFNNSYVVDGRLSFSDARNAVKNADVVWLSGGDTPAQFNYLKKYGLNNIIKEHTGVIIGMSAGAINLAKTAVCTLASGHYVQEVYSGLGCVDISVEPHFDIDNVSDEIFELSNKYLLYGLPDESMIVCQNEKIELYGDVYKIIHGNIEQINA